MGDVPKQDRVYSAEVVHKLLEIFEEEYQELGQDMPHHSMCSVMLLLLTCLGGMRGYEAVWTDLAGLVYDLGFCEGSDDYTAVSWPIVG